MKSPKKLLKEYAAKTAKPKFSNFVKRRTQEIEEISTQIQQESSLKLQNSWRHCYNKVMQVERPNTKLIKRFTRASDTFQKIFEVAKSTREARYNFRVATINISSSIYKPIQHVLFSDSDLSSEEEEAEDEEEDEVKEEKETNILESNDIAIIHEDLKEELTKLNQSKCINLLHDDYQRHYKRIINKDVYKDVLEKCDELKTDYESKLPADKKLMIDRLFNDLSKFRRDKNTEKIIQFIDDKKSSISDKGCDEYKLLCIVDLVVKSFDIYKKEDKLSESAFLRKFADIVEIMMKGSSIISKDGETVSTCTQRMQIINEYDIDYGRRIDLLVASEQDDEDIEICSVEFKKHNASNTILIKQQSKNLRINCCILNDLHLLVNSTDPYI